MAFCQGLSMSELFSTIIGHDPIKEIFKLQLANNTLSHAYCFVGPRGVGKRTFALELIRAITRTEPSASPDVLFVRRLYNPKKEAMELSIGVDQMREVMQLIRVSSFSGNTKCIVIEEAETMTDEAQNALLKLLEEPPSDTIIILIADALEELLPTIRSRSSIMRFGRVAREVIFESVVAKGVDKALARTIAGFADGCPGMAIQALERREAWEEEMLSAIAFFSEPRYAQFARIERVVKLKSREETERMIQLLRLVLHDLTLHKSGLPHLTALSLQPFQDLAKNHPASLSTLARALGILQVVQTAIRGNVAPALALEQFALSL